MCHNFVHVSVRITACEQSNPHISICINLKQSSEKSHVIALNMQDKCQNNV